MRGYSLYSMDLKVRIFEACQAGESRWQAARRFSVSQGFVSKIMQRFWETGSRNHLPSGQRPLGAMGSGLRPSGSRVTKRTFLRFHV